MDKTTLNFLTNFDYSLSFNEKGNIERKVRLVKFNGKILAFNIAKPELKSEFESVSDFLDVAGDCDSEIFEDLTGENIFRAKKKKVVLIF